jgi:hypothetical protein
MRNFLEVLLHLISRYAERTRELNFRLTPIGWVASVKKEDRFTSVHSCFYLINSDSRGFRNSHLPLPPE